MLQCVLQSNGKCGVLATDGGKVTCEGCEIKANRLYGLVCQNGAQATLTSNNICHNVAVRVTKPLYQATLYTKQTSILSKPLP